jgi:sugar/nucleoside kinase (ribokinase family)
MKKVLGIGNALVDVIIFLNNDEVLDRFSLPPGSMQLVDELTAGKVEEATQHCKKHMASGGSAANTIHGLAGLGVPTGFIGTVGQDPLGDFFREDLIRAGIKPWLLRSSSATGSSRALVSPGGERTMATFLGAAVELSSDLLDQKVFSLYDHLHLEGYLVLNQQLVEKALDYAHRLKMTVSLDLASYNVVESNLDFLNRIVRDHVDVVFANEEEARAFTGQTDPARALDILSRLCETAIVKIGEKGSLIGHLGNKYEVGVIPVHCLDTTGAGDLYAAGYLYGMANQLSPQDCGKAGALLAGKVIEVAGAKISEASWADILKILKTD